MSLFHFSSHTLHLFCLFAPICLLFSLKKKFFWVLSSPMPMPLPPFCFLFYFLFSLFSLNPGHCFPFLNPRHQTHLLFTTPSDQTHHHKHTSSLLPLIEPTIINLSILSLIEPTITNPTAYLLPLTEPFFSP